MGTNKTSLYLLRCITNLHVGSGDENYGVIDNRVQRDITTGYPTIFSSSLKGALREFFDCNPPYELVNGKTNDVVKAIFGSPANERDKAKLLPGSFRFLPGRVLSIPVKSNFRPYYNATCVAAIKELIEFASLVGMAINANELQVLEKLSGKDTTQPMKPQVAVTNPMVFDAIPAGKMIFIEDKEATRMDSRISTDADRKIIQKYFGEHLALLPDAMFNEFADELPVIARNQLEDGQSNNVWYEEVVPRESRFWFSLIHPVEPGVASEDTLIHKFDTIVLKNRIQMGANATIGYGITHISKP